MNDTTIFESKEKIEPLSKEPTVSVQEKPVSPNVVNSKAPWQVNNAQNQEEEQGGFPFGKIIKVFIGLVLFLILIFGVTSFILPMFNKSNNEKVTLVYWGLWDSEPIIKSIINDFQKQNPNITIEYKKEDVKQYRDKLVARIQNGTGPDLFLFHNTWLLQTNKLLLPLPSDIIKSDEFEKTYFPVIVSDLSKNGAVYGIPSGIDTLSLFINSEIFAQSGVSVPTTWQDFGKTARALTVVDETGKIKTSGAALGTYDNITHAPDIISLLFVQNGADLNNLSTTVQNAKDALDYYTDFAKGEGKVWDSTLDPSMLAFAKGNLAMYFGYSWDIFAIKAVNPNLSFQTYSVPRLPGRNQTIASYWNTGVSIKSKHQKEALLFLKYLSQKDVVQKLFSEESKTRLFGIPYARVDLSETLKDNVLVYPFVSQAKDAQSSFFASDTYDNGLNSKTNVYLADAVRAILNGTSSDTALETLIMGVDQVLSQFK